MDKVGQKCGMLLVNSAKIDPHSLFSVNLQVFVVIYSGGRTICQCAKVFVKNKQSLQAEQSTFLLYRGLSPLTPILAQACGLALPCGALPCGAVSVSRPTRGLVLPCGANLHQILVDVPV